MYFFLYLFINIYRAVEGFIFWLRSLFFFWTAGWKGRAVDVTINCRIVYSLEEGWEKWSNNIRRMR